MSQHLQQPHHNPPAKIKDPWYHVHAGWKEMSPRRPIAPQTTAHSGGPSPGRCPVRPAALHHQGQTAQEGIENLALLTSLVCSWKYIAKKSWISGEYQAWVPKTSSLLSSLKARLKPIPKELVAKWSAETSYVFQNFCGSNILAGAAQGEDCTAGPRAPSPLPFAKQQQIMDFSFFPLPRKVQSGFLPILVKSESWARLTFLHAHPRTHTPSNLWCISADAGEDRDHLFFWMGEWKSLQESSGEAVQLGAVIYNC